MAIRVAVVLGLVLAAISGVAQVSRTPPKPRAEFRPGPPIEQPLPFSHKTHVNAGVECLNCHPIDEPGDFAGIPPVDTCMLCHVAVKKDSDTIQQLAALAEAGRQPAWKRVYQVEEFVYFSHEVHHREAGVPCAQCHGAVAERDVLFREKAVSMYACMQCHEAYSAPNDCELCHDTH